MKVLKSYLNWYREYNWQPIGDFKMVGFLMGLQSGYTKYPCFLCLWDSIADSKYHTKRTWLARTELCVGKQNVKFE